MSEIFLVRQPIFDRAEAAVGYELRFRENRDAGDAFARSYMSGAFDVVRGGLPAWVRATGPQLLDGLFASPDPRTLVVLIPVGLAVEPGVVDAGLALARAGVAIALDDFVLPAEAGHPVLELVGAARHVRLDLRDQEAAALAPLVASLRKLGKRVVADQILDDATYRACLAAGFDAFEGPHFARPEHLPAAEIPTSTATALRLLALARDLDTPDRELEAVISADPGIAFQLLRIVNSAALGGRGITSIGHALRLVGRNNVIRWLALASYAARAGKSGVDDALVRQAVQRAHFCEAMAAPAGARGLDRGTSFLVGLFSLLDAVFRMPLGEVLERVRLADEVRQALVDREGPYAQVIQVVESYELGLWEFATESAAAIGIGADQLPALYAESLMQAEAHIPATPAPRAA